VLDVVCGDAHLADHCGPRVEYVGVDIDPDKIIQVKKKYPQHSFHSFDVCGSVFPFENEKFDAAIVEAFVEMIDNPRVMLSEIYRVLKPHGKVFLTAFTRWGKCLYFLLGDIQELNQATTEPNKTHLSRTHINHVLDETNLVVESQYSINWGINRLIILKRGDRGD